MSVLYMMIGAPGAGKSTVVGELWGRDNTINLISPDNELYENGQYVWSPQRVREAWNVAHRKLDAALKNRDPVIFDATLTRPRDRKQIVDKAKSAGFYLAAIFVDTPLDVCLARNAARSPDRQVPADVLTNMHTRLVPPTTAEGFDEVFHVHGT